MIFVLLKKDFFWYNAFGMFKPVPYELSVYELKQYIKKNLFGLFSSIFNKS